ncbi:MurR/RpiR family transcriptional regulator [Dactylosporangium roseum]|uniref:MurR/RpiR family transcriptional regulator n=1 Tax=Dactylosporangium roseum TaxID=47989 RepID=A0ABY5YWU8_9ACTN|nr:MurR/RpiR family transcriptional regulator [Dactylosporangium roseum]UWZ34220.1 MurR/RpiR family transcriptional regulator [Dactylosporangium roseum]
MSSVPTAGGTDQTPEQPHPAIAAVRGTGSRRIRKSGAQVGDKTVLASVRSMLESLPPGDRKVAQAILDDPEGVVNMTVAELASRAGTAESTAVRCCHKLGYRGYQDLKIHLARELATRRPQVSWTIDAQSEPYDVLRTVMDFNAELLREITSSITPEAFDLATARLSAARRVLLLGFGSSYNVCVEAQDRLASIGLDAMAPESPNMKLLQCRRVTPDDVVVCVSHTGATKELIRYAELAQSRRALVLAITSFGRSRLVRAADVVLVAGGRELDFRFGALSGRLAHLAVLDALYLAVAVRLGDRAIANLAAFHDEESAWRL